MYLRKQGVKNDEMDTYVNFLSVISHYFFSEKKAELSQGELNEFLISYNSKYNLPVKKEVLLQNLQITRMLPVDSFGNYYFYYPYLYYYFVAKYLAEHLDVNKAVVDTIIGNLHKDENAYIAVFMSHHSKNNYILDEILLNSWCLFDKYKPATLTKQDLAFFDDKLDSIVSAMLPSNNSTPEIERKKKLQKQDIIEEVNEGLERQSHKKSKTEEAEDELARELRRSIKTVEVMGSIVKNRSGSLEREKLEVIFRDAMNVYLRILSSFFDVIKDEQQQAELIDFITSKLDFIIQEKSRKPSDEKLQKLAKKIFWNLNFSVVYGFINMTISSLGSDKLQEIISKVCDDSNTPAAMLIKHGSLMRYSKNLQIDNIATALDADGVSETAKKIMKFMIVSHCSLHKIEYKDKQKIEFKLDIPSKQLLREAFTHPKK